MGGASVQEQTFLTLLQLEKEARHADTQEALGYIMVNRARVLVAHRQAILFRLNPQKDGPSDIRVQAISDVPAPDPNAPFVRWLKRVGKTIAAGDLVEQVHEATALSLAERDRNEMSEWLPAHMIWCPLKSPGGGLVGGLLLARDEPWQQFDEILMEHLSDAWGHAWSALIGPRQRHARKLLGWPLKAAAALTLLAQFIPVPQTALAPAEVVARHPELVAAPMDGAIKTVHVSPNSPVKKGDVLFSYDDTSLSGQLEVAVEELLVARTALKTARQGAFGDLQRSSEVALLKARVLLREAERDYISSQVARKDVRAGRDGVAVFRDASDLEGRPVTAGERVMLVAGPYETELRIELPVADAVVMEPGAPVRLFLDRDPLSPVDAVLEYAGYEAQMSSAKVLSYRLVARFADGVSPRIGLRGTAKVQGADVALFLFLFRRPLSALRQWFGL